MGNKQVEMNLLLFSRFVLNFNEDKKRKVQRNELHINNFYILSLIGFLLHV